MVGGKAEELLIPSEWANTVSASLQEGLKDGDDPAGTHADNLPRRDLRSCSCSFDRPCERCATTGYSVYPAGPLAPLWKTPENYYIL
jgi:hypothetical protein